MTAEIVEVWYADQKVEQLPRLRGRGKHRANYRYREELFPTSRFRMTRDVLREIDPLHANKRYLEVPVEIVGNYCRGTGRNW